MVRFSRALSFRMLKYGYREAGESVTIEKITGTLFCSGWWYIRFPHWYVQSCHETVVLETKAEVRRWIKKHCLSQSKVRSAIL